MVNVSYLNRYYWKEVLLICLGSLLSVLYSVFSLMPGMSSPFASNWSADDSDSVVVVALSFSVVALALIYQTYYAVVVFKVTKAHLKWLFTLYCNNLPFQILCFAPSTRYPLHVNNHGGDCGTRLVLTFSLVMSAATCAWLTLHSAVDLELNRGQQMELEPAFNPTLASVAGVVDIIINSAWNLHVLSLLILLSRAPNYSSAQSKSGSLEDTVKPISYSCDQGVVKEFDVGDGDDPTTTEQLMQLSCSENNNNGGCNAANIYLWQAEHYDEDGEEDQSPEHTFLEDSHYRHEYYAQEHQQQQQPRYYYYDDCLKEEEDEDDYCCEQDPKHLASSNSSNSSRDDEDDMYEVDGYESSLGPVVSPSLSADSRIYYRTCSR